METTNTDPGDGGAVFITKRGTISTDTLYDVSCETKLDAAQSRIEALEQALQAVLEVAFDGPSETKSMGGSNPEGHETVQAWRARVRDQARAVLPPHRGEEVSELDL